VHVGERGERDGNAMSTPVYAAIDLGTNNCRLLVGRIGKGDIRIVDSYSRIVRLGEGLSESGRLGESAIVRTIGALKVCADKIAANNATQVRAIATEACRLAKNCNDFIARVREATGIELEIITPEEEAQLTLDGCVALLDEQTSHALVFDIGGGSTELIWVDSSAIGAPTVLGMLSISCGVVTLSEKYGSGPVSHDDYEQIVEMIDDRLHPFDKEHGISEHMAEGSDAGPVQMLGTSGTVTTLGGIYLNLPRYDRSKVDGLDMKTETITAISARLAGMNFEERARNGCIGKERADLVIMGCAIMEAVCRRWPLEKVRAADRGIREGLLFGMMRDNGLTAGGADSKAPLTP